VRIWITADIHHGIVRGEQSLSEPLATWCLERAQPGDALVLAGDVACGDARGLAECLALFADFPGPRAFVPGNHDLWSAPGDGRGSLRLFEDVLPQVGREHGFALLDAGPLRVPLSGGGADANVEVVGIAGSFGGFDFGLADLTLLTPGERSEVREGWRTGRYGGVFWQDYRYLWRRDGVSWDHAAFARACAARLAGHLSELEADPNVTSVVCVTHTGAELEQVRDHPLGLDRPLAGNTWFLGVAGASALGEAIRRHPKARLSVCGHTHHRREHTDPHGRRWVNVGCDYDRKRWLVIEPDGSLTWTDWIH
jgi:hypothetical protein